GTQNGHHQSENTQYNYNVDGNLSQGLTRAVDILNDGNVAQTNVNVHIDVEPGTIVFGGGKSEPTYRLAVETTSENEPKSITVTLTNGTVIPLMLSTTPANTNEFSGIFTESAFNQGLAKDGSNIKAIDVKLANLEAGTRAKVKFATNALLMSQTEKQVGDQAQYQFKVTADQMAPVSGTMRLPIEDPTSGVTQFTGVVEDQPSGTYQPSSENGGNLATITYNFRSSVSSELPSEYLIAIPRGFDLADPSQLTFYQNGEVYSGGQVDDLGYVGCNGARMLKVAFPTTPYFGMPIYLQGLSNQPIQIIANPDELPGSYQYRNGDVKQNQAMTLIMAINQDGKYDKNEAFDKETLTLADGSKYDVVLSSNGFYPNFTEASYSFTFASTYGEMNMFKGDQDKTYVGPYSSVNPKNVVALNYSDNQNVANTTGTFRLINVLTDKSTSTGSNNVINLARIANGDQVDLTLTGPADLKTSGAVQDTKVLYSLTPATGASDISSFVSADQITDWSQVKAVALVTGMMQPAATAVATLPFAISDMDAEVGHANVVMHGFFNGDHSGVPYKEATDYHVNVQRYVDVKTNWLKVNENGEKETVKPASIVTKATGESYVTTPLAISEIPAGYQLSSVAGEQTGVAGNQNVEVTYVYEPIITTNFETQVSTRPVKFVDETGADLQAPLVQKATFTRSVTTNQATGAQTVTPWQTTDQFAEVKVPSLIDNQQAVSMAVNGGSASAVTDLPAVSAPKDNQADVIVVTYRPIIMRTSLCKYIVF
ncbi:MAG: MucBP domain-containing protein, partial [Limosilactobacillus sp.]|nr:MucBP domain-containing protein [Limosilactobacillus sp.]